MIRIPARRRSRSAALVAMVVATALLLAGCTSWFQAPAAVTSTSTPDSATVAPELEPFYTQSLVWRPCSPAGMQCATAKAPMNWNDPGQASIELALIRHQATGTRLGSLLVNPGGPGASGVDFVRDGLKDAVDANLISSYDIVGFDPRGVGASSAVSCGSNTVLDHFTYDITPGVPGTDAWIAASEATTKQFGVDCLQGTGALLQYVDTISAARDLDLLRALVGDTTLNYLGYSYGTKLGATYAELYPTKVGRLVLDGALDPATTQFELSDIQAKGFESAYTAYLKACIGTKGCPFTGTVAQALTETRKILDRLQASPLMNSDGRKLGANTMFTAIILPLYSKDNWPYLNRLFTEVLKGKTTTAFLLADSYNDRSAKGVYTTNLSQAFFAVTCLDYPNDGDIATMRAEPAQLAQDAPVFGPQLSYGGTSCAHWPFPASVSPGPLGPTGPSPILVVGTTNDPATPYVWAQNLSKELQNGHLITFTGQGHTAYNKGSSCVDGAVDEYFLKGTVPKKDPKC